MEEEDKEMAQILRFSSDLLAQNKETVSGGLQQLLIRKVKRERRSCSEIYFHADSNDESSSDAWLCKLPISVQLHILSYLDACDLCRMSMVSSHWNVLSNDDILWAHMLRRDMFTWHRIGHLTYPDSYYDDVDGDSWSMKKIYLKCCPRTNQLMRDDNYVFHQLGSLLRSMLTLPARALYQRPQRVAVFGPGLTRPTSQILNKMMLSTDRFRVMGVAPSEFQGIGSGLWVKVNNTFTINLVVLYPGSRSVRDGAAGGGSHHKLFTPTYSPQPHGNGPEGGGRQVDGDISGGQWSPAIQQLARTMDAFIFLVNTDRRHVHTHCQGNLNYAKQQLFSMCRDVARHVPVSVLSCVETCSGSQGVSCVGVCRLLDIRQLDPRPWLVHQCSVDDVDSVWPPLDWLLEQSQR